MKLLEDQRVSQFAYVGSIIHNTVGTESDITVHIWKAQIAFSELNKIRQSTAYSAQTKLRIFNTNMKAVLPYGLWDLEKFKMYNSQVISFY